MASFIKAISYALPETVLSNERLVQEFPEWSVEKIGRKIGVQNRHVVKEGECASDLAEKAALALFEDWGVDRKSVDFLLLCTQSPDYFLPSTACLLQHRLGLDVNCGALDFNLGCSGFVYGLSLSKGLIESGTANNVLLLTAETYTKYLHERDKGNRTIFGDAAAATLVSKDGFAEIGSFVLGTDGSGAGNLIVKSGAARNPQRFGDCTMDPQGNPISSDHLFMNGSEIFNFSLDVVPEMIEKLLKKNGITDDAVDLYVLHQANRYMLECLFGLMDVDEYKAFYCLSDVGNTVSSTIPIALSEAKKEGKLKGNVVIAGFGVGYSWGGCVLKCK